MCISVRLLAVFGAPRCLPSFRFPTEPQAPGSLCPVSPFNSCCFIVMAKMRIPSVGRAEKAYKNYRESLAKAIRELRARWEKRKGKRLRYALNNARRRAARGKANIEARRKRRPGPRSGLPLTSPTLS